MHIKGHRLTLGDLYEMLFGEKMVNGPPGQGRC